MVHLRAWGFRVTDVQEGRPVVTGPIVERLERIWAHESRLDVHALASNGGSAAFRLVMRRIAVLDGMNIHQWDLALLVRICSPFSLALNFTRVSTVHALNMI